MTTHIELPLDFHPLRLLALEAAQQYGVARDDIGWTLVWKEIPRHPEPPESSAVAAIVATLDRCNLLDTRHGPFGRILESFLRWGLIHDDGSPTSLGLAVLDRWRSEDDDGASDLALCHWYRGVGKCNLGCWQEPQCAEVGPTPERRTRAHILREGRVT